jgi:hypothetical protein
VIANDGEARVVVVGRFGWAISDSYETCGHNSPTGHRATPAQYHYSPS